MFEQTGSNSLILLNGKLVTSAATNLTASNSYAGEPLISVDPSSQLSLPAEWIGLLNGASPFVLSIVLVLSFGYLFDRLSRLVEELKK